MTRELEIKILIIGIIKKDNSILLRKKFAESKPYKETWYSFGCDFVTGKDPAKTFINHINDYLGIIVVQRKHLSWDSEIKEDHDEIRKQFIYLELECDYVSGEIKLPKELERVEFVGINDLPTIDVVPPSVQMLKRLGYL